ncbi:hypothetical protein CEXT_103771 [Caerostris extrusa]|uniref:Uncharacterized protein n=1 Tax=Caerostris extrusa TaxID=172846 RepID=A0AAV4QB53_CAEEX|nr:hypothetical protein CEXT_103771 [Caerostris extrusa]
MLCAKHGDKLRRSKSKKARGAAVVEPTAEALRREGAHSLTLSSRLERETCCSERTSDRQPLARLATLFFTWPCSRVDVEIHVCVASLSHVTLRNEASSPRQKGERELPLMKGVYDTWIELKSVNKALISSLNDAT